MKQERNEKQRRDHEAAVLDFKIAPAKLEASAFELHDILIRLPRFVDHSQILIQPSSLLNPRQTLSTQRRSSILRISVLLWDSESGGLAGCESMRFCASECTVLPNPRVEGWLIPLAGGVRIKPRFR